MLCNDKSGLQYSQYKEFCHQTLSKASLCNYAEVAGKKFSPPIKLFKPLYTYNKFVDFIFCPGWKINSPKVTISKLFPCLIWQLWKSKWKNIKTACLTVIRYDSSFLFFHCSLKIHRNHKRKLSWYWLPHEKKPHTCFLLFSFPR